MCGHEFLPFESSDAAVACCTCLALRILGFSPTSAAFSANLQQYSITYQHFTRSALAVLWHVRSGHRADAGYTSHTTILVHGSNMDVKKRIAFA